MELPHKSTWREAQKPENYPALGESIEAEVAIIGGGITGITAAYLMRNKGKKVVLLERGEVGDWASGSTTGFLMELIDTYPSELRSRFGEETARIVTQSHRDAISRIEKIVEEEKIECEFMRCPAYIYAQSGAEAKELQEELPSLKKVGTQAQFEHGSVGTMQHGYLKIERQAKFHSLKYIFALAQACSRAGVQLFEHTEVTKIEESAGVTLHTKEGHTVRAQKVLMATHYPLDPQPSKLRFKKAWYTTYVLEAHLAQGVLPEVLYEDMEVPYHYARIDRKEGYDRLILGGEDHRSDISVDEQKLYSSLEEYLQKWLPSTSYTLKRAWKGRVVEAGDGLAYLGPLNKGNIFYATAYSGTGLTYATIAAKLFADFVTGAYSDAARVYAADRPFSLRQYLPKAWEYIQELFGGAVKNTIRRSD